MPRPQAATKYNEILESVDKIKAEHKYSYVPNDSLDWRRLQREAKNLIHVNAGEGWTMLGVVYALNGNYEKLQECIQNVNRLPHDDTDRMNNYSSVLSLGCFSEALKMYRDMASPNRGNFLRFGNVVGSAFRISADYLAEAKEMGIDPNPKDFAVIELASMLMKNAHLSDEDVASHMDAAGRVLRKHNFFHSSAVTANDMDDDIKGITCLFGVKASPEDVFEMNIELAQEEERMEIKKSSLFEVVFISAAEL